MPAPTIIAITLAANLTCPTCNGVKFHTFPDRWRRSLCLSCGATIDADVLPPTDVFSDLLAETNAAPEVVFASVRSEVLTGRGW